MVNESTYVEVYCRWGLDELQIVDLLLCTGTFSSNTRLLFAVWHGGGGWFVQIEDLIFENNQSQDHYDQTSQKNPQKNWENMLVIDTEQLLMQEIIRRILKNHNKWDIENQIPLTCKSMKLNSVTKDQTDRKLSEMTVFCHFWENIRKEEEHNK